MSKQRGEVPTDPRSPLETAAAHERQTPTETPTPEPVTPPEATPKPEKPRRKLSTSLQAMAAIERAMSDLDARNWGVVATWFAAAYIAGRKPDNVEERPS